MLRDRDARRVTNTVIKTSLKWYLAVVGIGVAAVLLLVGGCLLF